MCTQCTEYGRFWADKKLQYKDRQERKDNSGLTQVRCFPVSSKVY